MKEDAKDNNISPPKFGFNWFSLLFVVRTVLMLSIAVFVMALRFKMERTAADKDLRTFVMLVFFVPDAIMTPAISFSSSQETYTALKMLIGINCGRIFITVVTSIGFFVPLYVLASILCTVIDVILFIMLRRIHRRAEHKKSAIRRERIKYISSQIENMCGIDIASEEMSAKLLGGDFVKIDILLDKVSQDAVSLITDSVTVKGGAQYAEEKLTYYVKYDEHYKLDRKRVDSQTECVRLNGQNDLLKDLRKNPKYFDFAQSGRSYTHYVCVDDYTLKKPYGTKFFDAELHVKLEDFTKLAEKTKTIIDRKELFMEENTRLLEEIKKKITY